MARGTKRAAPATTRAFLFSDLRDYTTFVETHGDAAAARLLRDYRAIVRREVARYKGAEVKTEGDSFYVVFDSASASLDCAVAILRRVGAERVKDAASPLRVGIGLHAGETIAFDKQFVGSAVNVASRLASRAGAGELLISDTLRGLVRTATKYFMSDRGRLELKGVSEPIQAWSVTLDETAPGPILSPAPAEHGTPAAGQILCPVVIGRDAELGQVDLALDAAAGGRGQTIVVAGEAGGGKSAFVREVERRASARGFRVLLGSTLESDRTLPYAPFIAAVRSGFRGIERERLGRVLAQTAPDLAQLFPELGRMPRPDGASALEQHRLAVAFHGLLSAFAREGSILIVLEDLHWSDEASLDLLHYLARELRDSRSLVLATYRSDEMHRRHPFLRTLGSLQRERLATEIALRRLTPDEVARLIQETFAISNPVSAEFRDAIYSRSEGNPFFTEELLKALVESGGIYRLESGWERKPLAELRIPASIREAVHARVEHLPAEAQTTLSAASVIGLRFPFEVLRATSGAAAADALAHLRQFIELQLVVEEGGEDDAYAFRHALTREVVYDELLAPERKALHRAVAAALETQPRTEPSLLTLHLIAAGAPQRAVPYLLEAARRAMAADAPREAATHYERALEIGVAEDALAITLEGLAQACLRFDIDRAKRAAEQSLTVYRKADDRRGMSRTISMLSWAAGLYAETRVQALVEEARDVVEGLGDTIELAHALVRLGRFYAASMSAAELRALAERVLELGERLNDPQTLAEGHYLMGYALIEEQPEEALRVVLRGRELAAAAGLAESVMYGYWALAIAMQRVGRLSQDVTQVIDDGLAHARRHGIEQTPLVPMRAYFHLNRGEWDEALLSAQQIEKGSGWYDNALEIRACIAEGREGPRAAIPLYLEHTQAWRALTGRASVPGLVSTAYAALLGRDRPKVIATLEELKAFVPPPRQLAGWSGSLGGSRLILSATFARQPEWIDIVESELRHGEAKVARAYTLACQAARALLSGDVTECGRQMSAIYELDAPPQHFGLDTGHVEQVVQFLQEARSAGGTIGPEWDGALQGARAFAEKAKATWWLNELAKASPQ